MRILVLLMANLVAFNISANTLNLEEASKHERWLRLLHYRKPMFGPRKSIVDNGRFFFSEKGKESAYDELVATLEAFKKRDFDQKKFDWHPQCAFPARLKFVKQLLNEKIPIIECPDFKWWANRISAKSLSLVFSSYYKGNPASMFGHTLLKFNSNDKDGKISDFTFNFAANVGEDKGLTYILKGLSGGFDGVFSTEPYYVKINDYVQGESRDVWEYLLDMNEEEIDWVVKHVWELRSNAIFDYYFLDENCSYLILAALDVGKLDWYTSRGFYYYTLPATTVKRIDEVGGIKAVYYRPSFRKKMMERANILDDKQKQLYFSLLETKKLKSVTDKKVAEAYIAYLRFKQFEEGSDGAFIKEIKSELRDALIHRAKLGGTTPPIDSQITERNLFDDPRKSHETYTLSLEYGNHNFLKDFIEFQFRFGVHDMMNNGLGLPRFSNIEVLSFRPRYYLESKKIRMTEVVFVDLLTLLDFDSITKDTSWGIRASIETPKDLNSEHALFRIRPVYGISKSFGAERANLYSLVMVDLQTGTLPKKDQSYRVGPGIEIGSLVYLTDLLKFKINGKAIYDFFSEYEENLRFLGKVEFDYSFGKEFEVKAKYQYSSSTDLLKDFYTEITASLVYFF